MAPFTSSTIGFNPREPWENSMREENAKQLVEDFFTLWEKHFKMFPPIEFVQVCCNTCTVSLFATFLFLQALQIVSVRYQKCPIHDWT